ncbi:MAG: hypothetical protein ACHQ7H_03385, partial [Candidatus Rokuibacteriota bacterium]
MREALAVLLALAGAASPAAGAELCAGGGDGRPRISEHSDPTFTFPTGVAVAPDGAIWVASTLADQLVRLEPGSGRSTAVRLPLRSHPAGLAVDDQGRVWFAASGTGLVGRLTVGVARATEFPPASLLNQPVALP